ncbi:glycosyltransferase family 4 protein [Candidatus Peregrinibacteria bacterium]|nr:glycosyltransferase family 4 protein [Candidatus Peregrinibacteria bacterium]MBI3816036.1 glycosyltransferase family 4 protein [Candidatus Peregrinibacteria bacterium]
MLAPALRPLGYTERVPLQNLMRILFTRFPLESAHGGAEIQTTTLMRGLIEGGHAVAFAGSCPVLLGRCREEGIPCVELSITPPPVTTWSCLSFAWRKGAMRRSLERMLAQFSPLDAICMLSLSEKLLLTEYATQQGIRVFWIEHDRAGRWLTKNPWLPKLRTLSSKATTIVVSALSKKIYLDLGWDPEKIVAIANGIERIANCEGQIANDSQLATRNSQLRIGCVARLSPEKGIDILLEAVRDLPDVRLTIVGKGKEEPFLRNWGDSINLAEQLENPRIELIPTVSALASFYRSCDVIVLPSREHDPFGLVIAEAMSLEIATIVTDACGIAGYLKNGEDALIVPAGSSNALRGAIVKLQNSTLREGIARQGQKTALEKFSAERMIDHYEKIIQQKQ